MHTQLLLHILSMQKKQQQKKKEKETRNKSTDLLNFFKYMKSTLQGTSTAASRTVRHRKRKCANSCRHHSLRCAVDSHQSETRAVRTDTLLSTRHGSRTTTHRKGENPCFIQGSRSDENTAQKRNPFYCILRATHSSHPQPVSALPTWLCWALDCKGALFRFSDKIIT